MVLKRMLLLATIFLLAENVVSYEIREYELRMPKVHPDKDELYLCTPVRIKDDQFYIVGFEPHATMDEVHHMLLFGCTKPGTENSIWDCGEMAVSEDGKNSSRAIPCTEGSHVLYAWARDAKKLNLPEDVGFQVGLGTKIKYLVLQIHYSKKFPDNKEDNSGISLLYTTHRQNKLAGVLLLGSGGRIPAHQRTSMEVDCRITEPKTIFPFAYRTHTHSLGKVVEGYRVRRNRRTGDDHWLLLGKRDPLTPQMFYPVFNRDPIYQGDILAARCTMDNYRDRDTYVGPTNNDEMCNFYLMYYVEEGNPLDLRLCFSEGPPQEDWYNSQYNLNHIPKDV